LNTLNGWPKPKSRHLLAASQIPIKTPWPRRSMACLKLKSFTAVAPGATMKLSNSTLEWINYRIVEETP
jgi:hypothetical protein